MSVDSIHASGSNWVRPVKAGDDGKLGATIIRHENTKQWPLSKEYIFEIIQNYKFIYIPDFLGERNEAA